MPSTPTKPARSAANPTAAAPKPSPSRAPPVDLTSKDRLRAKQYQRAHEQQRIRAECPLIPIHEPWDALRAAAPILPSSRPARERPSIADTGDAHSRRASTVPAALADLGHDESDDESDTDDDDTSNDGGGDTSRTAPFRDTTFLTGTGHIAGDDSDDAGSEVDATLDLDRYFAEYRMPRMPQWDAPLPTDMLASVRLLRQALRGSHVHYWTLHDAHYAAQTETSKRRTRVGWKRAYLDATYGESTPGLDASTGAAAGETGGKAVMEARKDGGEGDGSESDDAALLEENPGLRSPVGSEWSAASLAGDVPSSSWRHRGGSKKKKKGKTGAGAADGMGDVRNLMKKVHYKLQLLEAEMARMGAEETKRKREREAMLGGGSRLYLGSKFNGFSPAMAGASGNAAAKRSQLHMLVQSLSARPITPVRIPDLLRIGQAATAAANGQPVQDDPFGQHPLVANAQFLQRELPVRLALRCKAFQSLPFIVGLNPHIHKVYTLYLDSLERLTSFRPVVNEDDEREFTSMLTELVEAHVDVIQTISQGFLESRDYMPAQEIGQFLDKLIGARIGVRVLAEHHLALHSPQPDFIGIVDTKLSPVSVAQHVYDYVREVAQFHFGAAPALQIDGMVDTTLAYIPVHLDYILAELFKNSIRATVEHYEKTSGNGLGSLRLSAGLSDDDLPPIQLTVARGPDDVVMRIRDQGGGIPYEDLQRVFEYSYTSVQGKGYNRSATGAGASTADPQSAMSEMMMQSGIGGPIAGLGYGLGTARVYSRYFDGSLTMISLYGHGCDVFLRLKNIDMQEQLALRAQLIDVDDPANLQATLRYVAGVDISFIETPPDDAPPGTPFTQSAVAYVAVLSWPALDVVYTAHDRVVMDLPYIPTFLAFREVGPLAKLVRAIPEQFTPQVIFVDGNGVLHPRRFGLASHLGVVTGIPTIGVAKNFLQITNEGPEMTMRHVKAVSRTKLHRGGDQMPLIGTSGTVYGMAVLPCDGATNPIFVSVGHKVSLPSAVAIVLQSCKFRIPEPIRAADLKSRALIRQLQKKAK
ncbi:hypothetical protein GGF32_008755 [Allomyces javanicus]|nr:hypothetical protein GGF32_008755 [Allomyces javanicus]